MQIDFGITHLFTTLNRWAETSTGNYNQLIGGGFVLFILSWVLIIYAFQRLKPTDERNEKISLKTCAIMLSSMILLEILFPKGNLWRIYFLFRYALTFIIGSLYILWRYLQDVR